MVAISDYLRIMSSGNMAPHELEGLFDMELGSLKEEFEHPAHAVNRIADGLPGFGIVAAVLGIVVTMALLGQVEQSALGQHVGAALVGTFLGILAAYGFFGPLPCPWSTTPRKNSTSMKPSRPAWWRRLPACRPRWRWSSGARSCSCAPAELQRARAGRAR